jgi:hypothetical protein
MNQVSRISLVPNIRVIICHGRQQKLRGARYDRTLGLFSVEKTSTQISWVSLVLSEDP